MLGSIVRPYRWSAPIKWLLILSVLFILFIAIMLTADWLGLIINPLGWLNIGVLMYLSTWMLVDGLFGRRAVYSLCGEPEESPEPNVLFWRKVGFLASIQFGLAGAAIAIISGEGDRQSSVLSENLGPLFILLSSFGASFGWLYQGHMAGQSNRASETREAINQYLQSDAVFEAYSQSSRLVAYIRRTYEIIRQEPMPICLMQTTINNVPIEYRPPGDGARSLEDTIDIFFDALNRLAWEARSGSLDINSIIHLLRQRYVRNAFVFSEYIAYTTEAEWVPRLGRCRAKNKTWEHMLWLVTLMPISDSDDVDASKLVLPPLRA